MFAKTYINPIGGIDLYNKEEFKEHGLELKF
ncbi:MAG: WbqC family protein [Bacteroidetes bacterium]|nr:WbqC family protein [Bacteroidota bacterium]